MKKACQDSFISFQNEALESQKCLCGLSWGSGDRSQAVPFAGPCLLPGTQTCSGSELGL